LKDVIFISWPIITDFLHQMEDQNDSAMGIQDIQLPGDREIT